MVGAAMAEEADSTVAEAEDSTGEGADFAAAEDSGEGPAEDAGLAQTEDTAADLLAADLRSEADLHNEDLGERIADLARGAQALGGILGAWAGVLEAQDALRMHREPWRMDDGIRLEIAHA
jgi:hypothetical protein